MNKNEETWKNEVLRKYERGEYLERRSEALFLRVYLSAVITYL